MSRAKVIPVSFALVFAFSLSAPPSPALAECHNDCKSKYTECEAKCCWDYPDHRCNNHPFRSCVRTRCIAPWNDCTFVCDHGHSRQKP